MSELKESDKNASSKIFVKSNRGRPRLPLEELIRNKREANKRMNKKRIYIGECFDEWRRCRDKLGMKTDVDMAKHFMMM